LKGKKGERKRNFSSFIKYPKLEILGPSFAKNNVEKEKWG
jgi:hypothetical protein